LSTAFGFEIKSHLLQTVISNMSMCRVKPGFFLSFFII